MSEVQTVCACIHEMTHATLHNYEKQRMEAAAADPSKEPPKPKPHQIEEIEAESTSYMVCQYFGIETGENSFDELGMKKLPTVKSLQTEYAELMAQKKAAYSGYRKAVIR